MTNKKDLLKPSGVEKSLQEEFTVVISSVPTQKRLKKILPKIKRIKTQLEKKRKKKLKGLI